MVDERGRVDGAGALPGKTTATTGGRVELRRTSRHADRVDTLLRGMRPAETVEDSQIVAVAAALDRWPSPTMRPEFRGALRSRLVTGPAVGTVPATTSTASSDTDTDTDTVAVAVAVADCLAAAVRSPRRRRATKIARPALVGALASSVAVVGLTVGARDALPGEPLYSVKRQVEQIQVTLAGSETARARAHLDIARTRLDEMQSLVGTGASTATAEIPGLLDDWEREARSGGTVLVEQAEAGDVDALATMAEFTADQSEGLAGLVEELPEGDALATAEQALSYLEDVGATLDTFVAASPEDDRPAGFPAGSPSATDPAGATTTPTESAAPSASPTTTPAGTGGGSATTASSAGPETPPAPSSTGSAPPASPGARLPTDPVLPSLPVPTPPGLPVPTVPPMPAPPVPSAAGGGAGVYLDGQLSVQGLDGTSAPDP